MEGTENDIRCYECYIINHYTDGKEVHPKCPVLDELKRMFGDDRQCYNLPVIKHDVEKWEAGEREIIGAGNTIRMLAEAGHIQ